MSRPDVVCGDRNDCIDQLSPSARNPRSRTDAVPKIMAIFQEFG